MGAGDLLRNLDSSVLPPVARVMSRVAVGPIWPRLLTGVALLSVTVVVVTAVWTVDHAPTDDPAQAELLRVGVVAGQSVPGYVRSTRGELAALLRPAPAGATAVTDTYALVTLTDYYAPDRLTPVLGGVSVSEVYARAALTGVPTQVLRIPAYRVPEDVVAGMLDVARRRDRERVDYLQLASALGDADRQARRAYDNAAQIAASEAAAYRDGCSCVFAAVVRATPAALEQIAARPEVRAVDPAPELRRLDHVEFSPPLPEQQTTVGAASAPVAPPRTASVSPPRSTRPAPVPATVESTQLPSPAVTSPASPGPGPRSPSPAEAPGGRTAVPSALPANPTATS